MNVEARLKIKGKHFETLVDLDKALELKKGKGNVQDAMGIAAVFYDVKKGLKASDSDLKDCFGTNEINAVIEKIIKSGEVLLPQEYRKEKQEEKIKQVIDFLTRNAVDPRTNRPHTPVRIEESLKHAGINIDNKPVVEQINGIIEKLRVVLPIKIETKKLEIKVPAIHTGKVYGLLKEYKEREEWLSNGDLSCIINLPAGLEMDFYDKLNAITHGSSIVKEIKQGQGL